MNHTTPTVMATAAATTFAIVSVAANEPPLVVARFAVLGSALGATATTDVREHRIPNRVVVPASAVCAVLLVANGIDGMALVSAMVIVAGLLAASLVAPQALGMGDVKLALLIVLGLDGAATVALAAGFVLAALYSLLLIARHGAAARRRALPLAPFLALGTLIATIP